MSNDHNLSKDINLRRSSPAHPPHNDPHYYSYKLAPEPEEIEVINLDDTEDIIARGDKEEVITKLNDKVAALQRRNRRLEKDLQKGSIRKSFGEEEEEREQYIEPPAAQVIQPIFSCLFSSPMWSYLLFSPLSSSLSLV